MMSEKLQKIVLEAITDMKGKNITTLDIRPLTEIADTMYIVTGTSMRHVKGIANNVVDESKKIGVRPLGIEGEGASDWVLVDLGDVIVHVMLEETREYYNLERLWQIETTPESIEADTTEARAN